MKRTAKILHVLGPFALLCSLLGLSSCGPDFERLDIEELSSPPIPLSMSSKSIQMTAGIGIMISARPLSDNSHSYHSHTSVELESEDVNIIRVYEGEKYREFALVGVAPGATHLRVYVDGVHEDNIAVSVE